MHLSFEMLGRESMRLDAYQANAVFSFQIPELRFQISDLRIVFSGFRFQCSDFNLQIADQDLVRCGVPSD